MLQVSLPCFCEFDSLRGMAAPLQWLSEASWIIAFPIAPDYSGRRPTGARSSSGRVSRMLSRISVAALVLAFVGCNFTDLGNTMHTCESGTTCECNILGNCLQSCPGGNCDFRCKGTGNCVLDCEGGGCNAICENMG